jgi:putative pyruvate formate lyase activating enzyme
VRHLVLPGDLANTDKVLGFIAGEISRNTYVNIMRQYYPCYRAWDYPPLDRPITTEEYDRALAAAARHGLHRLDRPRGAAA